MLIRNIHIKILVLQNAYYEVFVTKCVSYDFGGNWIKHYDFKPPAALQACLLIMQRQNLLLVTVVDVSNEI